MGESVKLWQCPDCAFSFDAMHADEGGGYSCPACAETRLTAALALASANALNERLVTALADLLDAVDALNRVNRRTMVDRLATERARALLADMGKEK